jgi:hypothetical protein
MCSLTDGQLFPSFNRKVVTAMELFLVYRPGGESPFPADADIPFIDKIGIFLPEKQDRDSSPRGGLQGPSCFRGAFRFRSSVERPPLHFIAALAGCGFADQDIVVSMDSGCDYPLDGIVKDTCFGAICTGRHVEHLCNAG